MSEFRDLIFSGNVTELQTALMARPSLANEKIDLPENKALAHPLHRICDAVERKAYSEQRGIEIANLLLLHGADVNGGELILQKDTPLIAASSLACDQLALLYIERGANLDHQGCHGGTALHWAAWCGRDVVVSKLLEAGADINKLCIDFKSTPLFWAIHGLKSGAAVHQQVACAKLLIAHGADKTIPNFEGYLPVQLVKDADHELKSILQP